MIIEIKILPKPEVLDVQGRAIADTLKSQGYLIESCDYGKLIKLNIKSKNKEEAFSKAKKITETILCNPLTESYELKLLTNTE